MKTTAAYFFTFLLFISYRSSQQNAPVNKLLQVKGPRQYSTVIIPSYATKVAGGAIFLCMICPGTDNTRITTVGKMSGKEAYVFNRITQYH